MLSPFPGCFLHPLPAMKRNPARLRANLCSGMSGSNGIVAPVSGLTARSMRLLRSVGAMAFLLHLPGAVHAQAVAPNETYRVNGQAYPLYETKDWVAVRVSEGTSLQNLRADLAGQVKTDDTRQPVFHEKTRILVEPVQPGAAKQLTLRAGASKPVRVFLNGSMPPIVETEEFLVQFKPGVGRDEIDNILNSVNAEILRPLGDYTPNGYVARVRNLGQSIPAANTLSANADVAYAYPNFIWPKEEKSIPNDPLYGQQWHLNNTGSNGPTGGVAGGDIKAERAWEITRGSSSVVVAIVDDGVNTTHEDFKSTNKIQPGWDFVDNDNTPVPDTALDSLANTRLRNNHGTACAGLAVANGDNLKGGSGVAPGCRLMSVRLLGSNQTPESEAAAILSARDNGATIISNSWGPADRGGPNNTTIAQPCPPNVSAAITEVATNGRGGKGCIVLWAAGNGNESVDLDGYASHPHVICVGASNNQDLKASYSDFGDAIDIVAPGSEQDMVTTDRMGSAGYNTGNYTFNFNGTSAATPVAAGVCALLLSKEPNLTRSQVRQRLIDSADLVGGVTYDSNNHHAWYGYGRVNAWQALAWNDNTPPTATIRVPGNNNVSSALTEADGTASDTGTGVYQVRISLRDSLNRWWNWKTPGWSAPNAYVGDLDNHLALATLTGGTWKITLPALGNGSYRLHATTIDKADLASTTAVADYSIDNDGPGISFLSPAENSNHATPPTVGGVASDFIQDRRYSLFREADGFWYDFVAHDFTSATFNGTSHVDIVPSGTGFWDYAMPATLQPGRYQVHAITRDTSGRFSGWTSKNFRVAFPPQVTVHTPPHGTGIQDLESIGGTVNDTSGMGLQNNRVSFTLYNNGFYWTGSAWSTTQTTLHATVSGGSWTYSSVPSGSNERSGLYYISAFTTDMTGAVSVSVPGGNQTNFRLDRDPPSVAIVSPATGSTLTTASYQFRGTANDVGGIQAVNAFIRRASDSYYWNGSGWGISPIVLETTYNASNGEWIVNSGLPILRGSGDSQLPNGNYNFIAIAIDHAGNYLQTDSLVTVDYHQIFNWTAGSYSDLDPGNNNLNWGNPANWSPNGVPSTEDIVNIDRNEVVYSTVHRTVYGFNMSTGTIDFTNAGHSLTVRKNGVWSGGRLEDTVHLESNCTFELAGAGTKVIGVSAVINNSGVVTRTGGLLQGDNTSTWNNKPGSAFIVVGDGDVFSNNYGGNSFNNEVNATFMKATGAGGEIRSTIDDWTFNNAGKVESQQGVLFFNTTLNFTAGANLAGTGNILLGGTTNLPTLLVSTGKQELVGTLNATAPAAGFTGSQPLVWSGGAISGTFTLENGSTVNLTGNTPKRLWTSAVFTNKGRVNYQEGRLQGDNSSTFNNENGAVFDCQTDGDVFSRDYDGNVFNNKAGALFLKSGKSAAPDGDSLVDDWVFNNSGTIRSENGVLRFSTSLNLNAGGTVARLGTTAARVRSTGTITLTGITTISNITLESANVWQGNTVPATAGNGTLATTAGGVFEWAGGTFNNVASLAPGSQWLISGNGTKDLGGSAVLKNNGTVTWTGTGNLLGQNTSTIENLASSVFNVATDADFVNNYGGNRVVVASGATFRKTTGSDITDCGWRLENAGTTLGDAGVLAFSNGGGSSGTFTCGAAGEIRFSGGDHHLNTNALFNGTGKIRVQGGTLVAVGNINSNSSSGLFEIASGLVTSSGGGSFNAVGNIRWSGGFIGGVFNILAGSPVALAEATNKTIHDSGVINNHGSVTLNAGVLLGNSSSTWNNKPGSSFILAGDGDVFTNNYGGNVFNNEAGATFVKTIGAGGIFRSTIDDWTFNNAGKVESQQGILFFNTTQNLNAGSTLAGTGNIVFHGTTNLSTLLVSTGKPELTGILIGTLATSGYSGTQPFVWSDGWIAGSFTLESGSVLNLAGPGDKRLGTSAVFNNKGRVNHQQGRVMGDNSSTFNNQSGATYDSQTDGDLFYNNYGGNVFNNLAGALFLKSGKTADPDGSTMVDDWTFNNSGTLRSDTGLLRFNTGLNLNAGSTISRIGTTTARVWSSGTMVLTGTTTISNVTLEASGTWVGNNAPGTAGNGTLTTVAGGVFEWTQGFFGNTASLAAGSQWLISGGGVKYLGSGAVLKNSGSVTRTGGGVI
ncbi:MAG: hypothetical protein EOP88_17550, partial [Verrucomicrobiaceae bacterium]